MRRKSKRKVSLRNVEVKCTQSSTKYVLGINAGVHSRGGRLPTFRKPSVVAGRIATCCTCARNPLIGDAARPSKLASQHLARTPARRKSCQSTKQSPLLAHFRYRCRNLRPTELPRFTLATPRDPGV